MSIEPKPTLAYLCDELRQTGRRRNEVLKSRNMQSNRLRAIVAGHLGYRSDMKDAERKKKFQEAAALIKAVSEKKATHPDADLIDATLLGVDAFDALKDGLEKEMARFAKKLPVAAWVNHPDRRGFSFGFLALVVAETDDLNNYPNPAKLWRRMGCAPWSFGGETHMGATWRKGKEGKLPAEEWANYGYSPRRRSLAYLIGENIVKQNFASGSGSGDGVIETVAGNAGPYRLRYDEAKARAKETHPDWFAKRCHLHGMLLATKLLLKELWVAWRQ